MKIELEANIVRRALKNAYFINGTAYAGKSTAVRLLSEKYGGIMCGENYHDTLMDAIDPERQPCLSYFSTMSGWQEFISRTPEEYSAWIDGCSREAAELEIVRLIQLAAYGRPMFVDTNISTAWLRHISDYRHVALMVCPQEMSVSRFFDRPDADKQFLLKQIQTAPDPDAARENFMRCIERINSDERRREFEQSGFYIYERTETSTIDEAVSALEQHFELGGRHGNI